MSYEQKTLLLVLAQRGWTVSLVPKSDLVQVHNFDLCYRFAWDSINLRPVLVQTVDQRGNVILEVVQVG